MPISSAEPTSNTEGTSPADCSRPCTSARVSAPPQALANSSATHWLHLIGQRVEVGVGAAALGRQRQRLAVVPRTAHRESALSRNARPACEQRTAKRDRSSPERETSTAAPPARPSSAFTAAPNRSTTSFSAASSGRPGSQ